MNFLNFDIRKAIALFILAILPLININMQQNRTQIGWYDKPFFFLGSVSQNAFFSFSEIIRNTTSIYVNLVGINKKNKDLQIQNDELLSRLQTLDETKKENDRLVQLLDFKHQSKMELIAAKVMSKDAASDHSTIQLNKGSHHGLKSGQAVITTKGAVGYILKPDAFTSQVLLITDRYSVVDGMIARSRARGIVEGKNQTLCTLTYVEKSEDVKSGDLVVTSGLDNIFPKGLPIATVETVENKTYAVSLKVDLKPVVDANQLEEVFVVTNAMNEEIVTPSVSQADVETK